MLIQFNFKNYKSFRDEVSLDLSATKITEHENHVVNIARTSKRRQINKIALRKAVLFSIQYIHS